MFAGTEPVKTEDTSTEYEFLRVAYERANMAALWWQENFRRALKDLNFLYEEQWTMEELNEREGRPTLTMNKLTAYVDQVVGDQRQNRPSIKAHAARAAVLNGATQQGMMQGQQLAPMKRMKSLTKPNKDYEIADVRSGLIKNIEYNSDAESPYDMAFQHAVESGFGWLRVFTKYSDDSGFDQDIKIKAIRNRFAVLMDPIGGLSETDFSGAEWCFVMGIMRRSEFNKRYPSAVAGGMTDTVADQALTWYMGEDVVTVAEYFYREPVTRRLLQLSNGKEVWYDEVKDIEDEMARQGIQIVRDRKVKTHRVMWCKITGNSILEKPIETVFSTIPVVPVFGKEATIKDLTIWRGLIRYARDAQRAHNFWFSAATERVALAPKAQWVVDARSIEGLEPIWKSANRKNWSYLPYRHRPDVPPPRREAPPQMPNAELQLVNYASDEIKATTGLFDASLGAMSNETSGKAIIARQRQGDRGTFPFQDNLSKALRRVGMLCNEGIDRIYDGSRIIRIMFPDGGGDWIAINQVIRDEQTGKLVVLHDINEVKCDITVDAGPNYQTQRAEAADSFMNLIGQVGNAMPPQITSLLSYAAMRNMDAPGMDDVLKAFKKLLQGQQVLEPDDDTPPPQPTPADQIAMAKTQADMARAQADVKTAEAKGATADAQLAQAQAQLATIAQQVQMMQGSAMTEDTIRNLVAEAMAEIMHMSQQGQMPQSQQQGIVAAQPQQ